MTLKRSVGTSVVAFVLFGLALTSVAQKMDLVPIAINLFTSTECPWSPSAAEGLYQLMDELPPDSLVLFEYHSPLEGSGLCKSSLVDTLVTWLDVTFVPSAVINCYGYIGGGGDHSYYEIFDLIRPFQALISDC